MKGIRIKKGILAASIAVAFGAQPVAALQLAVNELILEGVEVTDVALGEDGILYLTNSGASIGLLDSVTPTDNDGDGLDNANDNCPSEPNSLQADFWR